MIAELFENILIMTGWFPPVAVIPAIIVILIIRKSKDKSKLKKRFLFGFFIFMAMSVISETILYTDAINFVESLSDHLGGFFFMVVYYAVQAFCFFSGVTLLVACIVLSVQEKKERI
ncbi:MAG: hypothetical protein NC177_03630 [Ruminococcus flavefaciens]|nr:hypothetical protein [Ruminococcus flavefaciens]